MSLKNIGLYDLKGTDASIYKRQRTYLLIAVGCLGAICIGLFVGLLLAGSKVHLEEEAFCLSSSCTLSAAELMHAFNRSVDPCEDFYDFVCGTEDLPEGGASANDQFYRAGSKINDKMRPLLLQMDPSNAPIAVQKAIKLMKVCDHFTNLTDARNLKILKDFVQEFGGWPLAAPGGEWDHRRELSLELLLPTVKRMGFPSNIITLEIRRDQKQLDTNRITLGQPFDPSLGIISKRLWAEEELSDDELELVTDVHFLAALLGNNDTKSIDTGIAEIFQLMKDLKKIHVPRTDIKNDILMYNKMTIRELQNITDNKIDWLLILKDVFKGIVELEDKEKIIVRELEYIKKLPAVIEKYNPRVLANYIITHVLLNVKKYVNTLYTTPDYRLPFCYWWTKLIMPHPVSRVYMENFFHEENRKEVKKMIEEIREVYKETISSTTLMDNETSSAAMKKIDNMAEVIGYPEWIYNNETLNDGYDYITVTDNHLRNIISISRNASLEVLKELREPPDNSSSDFNPMDVNAYYDPDENRIVIPAGILQPPFFQSDYTLAKNFGALGSIIGHEIGHGFDSTGRMHDEKGRLSEWWSAESLSAFENKTQCFIEQYSTYCPTDYLSSEENNTCIDGNYTLTENMADNSGVRHSFKAYKKATEKYGIHQKLPGLGEFTRDQVFFISFADGWCETLKKGAYSEIYGKDVHALPKFRVIGSLSNFPEFAKAFNCPLGPMNRGQESCSLWT